MTVKSIISFHSNGRIKSEVYENSQGQKHGVEKWWRVDGSQINEVPYLYGETHGMVKWWYKNGQPENEISYHQGKLHGTLKVWSENGDLVITKYHLHGNEITKEEYEAKHTNKPQILTKSICTCDTIVMMNNGCPSTSGGICPNRH